MFTKKRFTIKQMVTWTRQETYIFFLIAFVEVALFVFLDLQWLQIPFTPIALIGTAVAFVIGFQNNASYGRIWEARQIWGGIVNTSRTFGIAVQDIISKGETATSDENIKATKKSLIYRHIAWLTALRYAMRDDRPWEYVMQQKTNIEWSKMIHVPEVMTKLEDELDLYLSEEDKKYVLAKTNKQTAILFLQSKELKKLRDEKLLTEFSFLKMESILEELFNHQGKSERIKNFPYPRQFATLMYYFTWIFIFLLPLGITSQFGDIALKIKDQHEFLGAHFIWFAVPFSVVVMWIFHTMNRIGSVGENPFEKSTNDVPISTIARGIEIDLRENLGENKNDIPGQFPVNNNVQM